MTTTLTDGTTVIQPVVVDGYSSTRDSQNLIHSIIGRPDPDVTLAPAGVRTGTLYLLFYTLDEGLTAEAMHALPSTFTLEDTDHPALAMTYVAAGTIRLELDDESRVLWKLAVDFHEVLDS